MLKYFEISGLPATALRIAKAISMALVDQPVSLQFHLAARDIEARDQLLVGAGGGVGEHRFVELRFHGVEFDVLDEQHRALPQRGHRLVGGIGLIDPQT